ncbi:DNA methyltransferase [Halorarius halobius]|uniref:DNA methyltransferase n=1 Tax=Halorarius halobius TaxID=2962671 RepID=UPI0020CDB4E9|nr:DNA methyltransferase [Halorarius halobius]
MADRQESLNIGDAEEISFGDFEREIADVLNENQDSYPEPPTGLKKGIDRRNPIYDMHIYWTKKPHTAIQSFIEQLSEPGDVVLDSMCGSGSTGVGAVLSDRKTVLNDVSPAATWITKNTLAPVDLNALDNAFNLVAEDVREEILKLYRTTCNECSRTGTITYTRWAEIHECKRCGTELNLEYTDKKPHTSKYICSNCDNEFSPGRQEPADRVPVEIHYECDTCGGRGNETKRPEEEDIERIDSINKSDIEVWFPTETLVTNSRINVDEGMTIPDLYTPRNLTALAKIHDSITKTIDNEIRRNLLLFTFTAILPNTTKMAQDRSGTSIMKGTYYIPPMNKEINVWNSFEHKYNRFVRKGKEHFMNQAGGFSPKEDSRVYTGDARNLSQIPDNTIDYAFIDPPYGDTVPYGEVNKVWTAWLKDEETFEDEIVVSDSPEREEKDEEAWEEDVRAAFEEVYRVLKPGRWLTITFNNSDPAMWERFNNAILDIGFTPYNGTMSLDMKLKTWKQMKEDKAQRRDTVVNYFKLPENLSEVKFDTPPEEVPEDIQDRVEAAIDDTVRSGYMGKGVLPEQVFHEVISVLNENNALHLRPDWEAILKENYEKEIDQRGRTRWHPTDYYREYDPDLEYFSADLVAQRAVEEHLEENGAASYSDLYEVVTNQVDQQPENFDELLERNFIKNRKKWRLPETEDEKLEIERRQEGHQEHIVDQFVSILENDEHIEEAPPLHVLEYGIRYLQEEDRHREALLLYDYIDIEELPDDVQSNIRRRRRISEAKAKKVDNDDEENDPESDPEQSTLEDIDEE